MLLAFNTKNFFSLWLTLNTYQYLIQYKNIKALVAEKERNSKVIMREKNDRNTDSMKKKIRLDIMLSLIFGSFSSLYISSSYSTCI